MNKAHLYKVSFAKYTYDDVYIVTAEEDEVLGLARLLASEQGEALKYKFPIRIEQVTRMNDVHVDPRVIGGDYFASDAAWSGTSC